MKVPPPPTQFAIGPYQGTCTNTSGTKPVVSRLTLTVTRQENQTIHGKIVSTGALKVNQDFKAAINDNQLNFVTSIPSKKLTIEWHAVIQDGAIRGTFSATQTGLWVSFFGKKNQHGEWQCKKERFPIVRRLKSFAKGVLGVGVLLAVVGGVIALLNSGSAPTSSEFAYTPNSDSSAASSHLNEEAAITSRYEAPNQPYVTSSSSTGGHQPRISDRDLAEVGGKVYNYVLDENRVDVREHFRGDTLVQAHDRQPPGGFTAGDKVEAGAWALAAVGAIKGAEYLVQQFDPDKVAARKQAEEQQRAESFRRFREEAEKRQQGSKKPWYRIR